MATSGRVNSSKAKSSYVYCKWSQDSQSVGGNSTKINWSAGIHVGGGNKWYSNAVKITGVWINGDKVWSGGTYSNLTSDGDKSKKSGTVTIPHNSDGTKSFSVKITGWFYGYGNKSGSDTFTLATIPRASVPTKAYSTVSCGNAQTIYTNRASSAFTHTVKISFGSKSMTQTGVGASWAVTIPDSWATEIPNATSGTATVSCTTYSGSTNIGTKTTTFTINVPSSYIPTFESPPMTITEAGTIPNEFASITSNNKFIQSLSKLNITPNGIGVYNSTIKQYVTTVNGKTYTNIGTFTSDIINASGNLSISLTETDSRNRTNSTVQNITVVPYNAPILNSVSYKQENGRLSISINGSISSVENNNRCTLIIKYKAYGETNFTTITVYNAQSIYDINTTYNIENQSISESTPYDIQILLNDVVYTSQTDAITKNLMTNLPTKLIKTNQGYMTFTLGGKGYLNSYLQSNTNLSWSENFDTSVPNTFIKALYDKSLNCNVGYTSNNKIIYSQPNVRAEWQIDSVSENVYDINTAFDKVICLTNSKIYWYNTDKTLLSKSTPKQCNFIVGNKNALYIIAEDGDIYYLTSLNDTWNSLTLVTDVQSTIDANNELTLKDIAPIYEAKFIATPKALVGIVNTNNGWRIVSAPTVSLR